MNVNLDAVADWLQEHGCQQDTVAELRRCFGGLLPGDIIRAADAKTQVVAVHETLLSQAKVLAMERIRAAIAGGKAAITVDTLSLSSSSRAALAKWLQGLGYDINDGRSEHMWVSWL